MLFTIQPHSIPAAVDSAAEFYVPLCPGRSRPLIHALTWIIPSSQRCHSPLPGRLCTRTHKCTQKLPHHGHDLPSLPPLGPSPLPAAPQSKVAEFWGGGGGKLVSRFLEWLEVGLEVGAGVMCAGFVVGRWIQFDKVSARRRDRLVHQGGTHQ